MNYDHEQPQWERFDSIRSINALIKVALAEIKKEDDDVSDRTEEA